MSLYSTDQLEEGRQALIDFLKHFAIHGEPPKNALDVAELPVEIRDPDSADVITKTIGELTPDDLLICSKAIKAGLF